MTHWSDSLSNLDACRTAVDWARTQPDAETAWQVCERADWMLWVAARLANDRRVVVAAACACARLSLPHVPEGELRPLRAIETAEAWCHGEATIEDVLAAAHSVSDGLFAAAAAYETAAYAADADAAAAAYAATYSAFCAAFSVAAYAAAADAAAAAYAAADAADAASAAYADADADYADAARSQVMRECTEIVRKMVPMPEVRS